MCSLLEIEAMGTQESELNDLTFPSSRDGRMRVKYKRKVPDSMTPAVFLLQFSCNQDPRSLESLPQRSLQRDC